MCVFLNFLWCVGESWAKTLEPWKVQALINLKKNGFSKHFQQLNALNSLRWTSELNVFLHKSKFEHLQIPRQFYLPYMFPLPPTVDGFSSSSSGRVGGGEGTRDRIFWTNIVLKSERKVQFRDVCLLVRLNLTFWIVRKAFPDQKCSLF